MDSGLPSFPQEYRVPWYSRSQQEPLPFRVRGYHPLWRTIPCPSTREKVSYSSTSLQPRPSGLTTPISFRIAVHSTISVWAPPLSLATTQGMLSFPRGTKMFQFPRFPPAGLCVQPAVRKVLLRGFPHSGISGYVACTRAPQSFSQCATPFVGF